MERSSKRGTSRMEVPSKTSLKMGQGKANFSLAELVEFTALKIAQACKPGNLES